MFWKNLAAAFKQIHLRLVLIVTLVAAVASVLVFGVTLAVLLYGFESQDRMELDSRLLSYWAAWEYGGTDAVINRASEDIKEHGGRPFLVTLNSGDGEMLCAFVPGAWQAFDFDNPVLRFLRPGSYVTLKQEGLLYNLRATGVRLEDGSVLMVGLSTENRQILLRTYRRIYPWVLGVIVVAGLAVGIISSRRLLSPIVRLNGEIDRIIVTGELGYRLESRGTEDELDGLVLRYNRLLDRVEALIGGMKDTLDAVAHDLRTPLTRLRGNAEIALREAAAEGSDKYEDVLATVVEQTDQAVALLSALMDISEAEQSTLNLDLKVCSLGVLASQVCDMYSFVAEEKGQSLTLDADEDVSVLGDAVRLRQIFGNLLDNAVKYSPEGCHIFVRCRKDGEWGVLEVDDDGPGVPADERSRIFERLYRGDRSRGSRGLGLGLSLVKALVEAHGGTVKVEDKPAVEDWPAGAVGGVVPVEAGNAEEETTCVSQSGARFVVKIPLNIS